MCIVLFFCSVVPFFNADGDQFLPLSIVQNAARLLTDIDLSALPVRLMSSTECQFINDSCRLAGMQFVVDQSTLVIGLLSVCQLCRRVPIIRYLSSDDPLGSALYVDVEEKDSQTKTTGVFLDDVADASSVNWQIVDVRGNAEPASTTVAHVGVPSQVLPTVSFAIKCIKNIISVVLRSVDRMVNYVRA
jgi:hypothetical protein